MSGDRHTAIVVIVYAAGVSVVGVIFGNWPIVAIPSLVVSTPLAALLWRRNR